jgi:hypothetical protein
MLNEDLISNSLNLRGLIKLWVPIMAVLIIMSQYGHAMNRRRIDSSSNLKSWHANFGSPLVQFDSFLLIVDCQIPIFAVFKFIKLVNQRVYLSYIIMVFGFVPKHQRFIIGNVLDDFHTIGRLYLWSKRP